MQVQGVNRPASREIHDQLDRFGRPSRRSGLGLDAEHPALGVSASYHRAQREADGRVKKCHNQNVSYAKLKNEKGLLPKQIIGL